MSILSKVKKAFGGAKKHHHRKHKKHHAKRHHAKRNSKGRFVKR